MMQSFIRKLFNESKKTDVSQKFYGKPTKHSWGDEIEPPNKPELPFWVMLVITVLIILFYSLLLTH